MDEEFKAQTLQAINDLHSINKQRLNRLLACEALLHSMIQVLDHRALAALSEEYDATLDRLATQLAPEYQQPERWADFSAAIEERQKQIRLKTGHTPGAD